MPTSDLQLRRLKIQPLANIPNKEGFVFIGVRRDLTEAELTVKLVDGHYTCDCWSELVGWKRL